MAPKPRFLNILNLLDTENAVVVYTKIRVANKSREFGYLKIVYVLRNWYLVLDMDMEI